MGSKSSGGERVAWAIGTGGLSEQFRKDSALGYASVGYNVGKVQDAINAPGEEARKQTELMAEQMRKSAEDTANQKTAADKAMADQAAKDAAGLEQKSAKARQNRLAMGAKGRSDTILTGPLGLTASGPKSGRTLLGS